MVDNGTNKSDYHVEATEFDAIGQHVKKRKRGARRQKATTVLPNRTVAT